MKKFDINNKSYVASDFDFNFLCDLEDMGVSLDSMTEKPISAVRAYFSKCSGLTPENAGKEIEAHLIGGSKLDDIMEAMSEKMNESDFFRAISKTEEEKVGKAKSKKVESN